MTAKTVEKSLTLLELLARSTAPRGVSEIARELNMPKSNVYRLLDTLVSRNYVRRSPGDSRYELSLKLWELGNQMISGISLPEVARPYMSWLADETGESVQLAVFDEGQSVFIDKKDSAHPIGGRTKVGSRAPAHCCATGKAVLAFQPPEDAVGLAGKLTRHTPNTITTAKALNRELEAIRSKGYAVNRGEWYEDVWGIAAAIHGRNGAVSASIGIWGPKERLSKLAKEGARPVVVAAANISIALGFSPGITTNPSSRRAST